MMTVHVTGRSVDRGRFCQLANQVQSLFRFGLWDTSGPRLSFTEGRGLLLFTATRDGISVSLGQGAGVSWYAGIEHDRFLFICALLGLTTWKILTLNPLLVPEDLLHPESDTCLFASRTNRQGYTLLFDRFDKPSICPGCIAFYRCLGAEPEIDLLLAVLSNAGDYGFGLRPNPRKN